MAESKSKEYKKVFRIAPWKHIFLTLVLTFLLLGGLVVLVKGPHTLNERIFSILIPLISVLCLPLFIINCIPRVGLIVTDKGIVNKTTPWDYILFEWKDIRHICISRYPIENYEDLPDSWFNRFLQPRTIELTVTNIDKYFPRLRRMPKWIVRDLTSKSGDTVNVMIQHPKLIASEEKILREINKFYKKKIKDEFKLILDSASK
jgi:hypothetical protein